MKRVIFACAPGTLGVASKKQLLGGFDWNVAVSKHANMDSDWDIYSVDIDGMIVEVISKDSVWVPRIQRYVHYVGDYSIDVCKSKI